MDDSRSARSVLRTATATDHDRVDRAFGGFDLGNRDDYRAFLIAQAQPLLTVEAAIDAFDPAAILHDWADRRRAHLIVADLAELDAPIPDPEPLSFDSEAAALGAIYVLEGSRLGGLLLARSIPSDVPARFMRSPPMPQRWRSLIEVLEENLADGVQRDAAIDAARAVFGLFWRSTRQHGRMPVVE